MKIWYTLILALTIELVLCQTEPLAPCDTCCRGSQGNHGLNGEHGLPGRDGMPGLSGMKGEKGDSGLPGTSGVRGDYGLNGAPGAVGLKGETGFPGLRGFDGAKGRPGVTGLDGRDGKRGRKGEKGDSGASNKRSAFTVARSASMQSAVSREAVNYTSLFTNEGNHFDLDQDRFTCAIPGVYVFNFQAVSNIRDGNLMKLVLHKNDDVVTAAQTSSFKTMASGSAILSLEEGDKMYVTLNDVGERIHCDSHNQCLFSGFLLYEN